MDIAQLRAVAIGDANPLISRVVSLQLHAPDENGDDQPTGETQSVTIYFRKFYATDAISLKTAEISGHNNFAAMVHQCVLNEHGARVFTLEEALRLKAWVLMPLVDEVSKFLAEVMRPKASTPKTRSGTKSPSASADEQ